jgi:hypothetical protein
MASCSISNSAATFEIEILTATLNPTRGVILQSRPEMTDFMAMSKRRGDTESHRKLWLPGGDASSALLGNGLELSNVGISLAPTTVIDGQSYAVLARRRLPNGANRIMLVSGYVDAAKFSHLSEDNAVPFSAATSVIANTASEAHEEINFVRLPGWFSKTEVRGEMIRAVADELKVGIGGQVHSSTAPEQSLILTDAHEVLDYNPSMWWRLQTGQLPNYIHNVFTPPTVEIDGVTFPGAGFQFHMHTNSGQIIIGVNLTFDLLNREFLSLIHAEDGPLSDPVLAAALKSVQAPPDALATRLDKYRLLLCPLDEHGQLTARFYNFIEGSLRPAQLPSDLEGVFLSDAFVFASPNGDLGFTPLPGMKGFVDRADIPARKFFRLD